ncbi:YdiU family protein [Luteimonas yindakuii]|uniref:protein adenylyltransferase SelO n=1 Tax=Luteimonas yindakuii TaxID=2565782 RepID=UPI0010A383B1|nr:YdiU family protein [Luteimonas yindakuii]QCO67506.1 YdiU family protein [Luteimonas yindakuii]
MTDNVLQFDNAFLRELPGDPSQAPGTRQVEDAAWSMVMPTPVSRPELLAWSPEVAEAIGFSPRDVLDPAFVEVFAGNALLPGMQAYAANYGGHQFGHWAGQLGDGRAIALGEAVGRDGGRHELQLKGAGPTPYSRGADGRAVLRSSLREFVCSEAMHHLGVPTTRALSLVATGDSVVRDMFYDGRAAPEPGAIVCRVAPSFIRFGSFELPYVRGDIHLLRRLVDFTIARDFPHLPPGPSRYADWFAEVCSRTATLMAEWMRVGFVHGVMNTDNMSILGLTIDYGPYGWIEPFDPDWTPNTTDAGGRRYRFGWQPRIAHWNLGQLAQALSPLFDEVAPLQAGLDGYAQAFTTADRAAQARKLGLERLDDDDVGLLQELLVLLHDGGADMTLFYRALGERDPAAAPDAVLFGTFYGYDAEARIGPALAQWLARYAVRVGRDPLDAAQRRETMRRANPRYVPRNWLLQEAIDAATAGDLAPLHALQAVFRHPYDDQPGREAYARKRPDWAANRAGCSMLSCSS